MTGLVVDTSAAVAVLTGEPSGAGAIEALGRVSTRLISAATLMELGIVLEARFGPVGGAVADRFLREGEIEVVDLDRSQAEVAIAAWRTLGRGNRPARLNLGDCFTYALTSVRSLPVLAVGDDLAQTDLEVISPT